MAKKTMIPQKNLEGLKNLKAEKALKNFKAGKLDPSDIKFVLENWKGKSVKLDLGMVNPQTLALAGYNPGSEVGLITIESGLIKALKNYPEQFYDENGDLILGKIQCIFKQFGKEMVGGAEYQSVLPEYVIEDREGKMYLAITITKEVIIEFFEQLKMLGNVTQEVLVQIATDIEVIMRALQELAIDVAKDESKDLGFSSQMHIGSHDYASRLYTSLDSDSNLDDILKSVTKGDKNLPEYRIISPLEGRLPISESNEDNEESLLSSYIIDNYGGQSIQEGIEKAMNGFLNLFNGATNKILSPELENGTVDHSFSMLIKSDDENTIKAIKICRIALNSLNGLMFAKEEDGSKKYSSKQIAQDAEFIRDAVYTALVELGITKEEVIYYAVAATFTSMQLQTWNTKEGKRYPAKTVNLFESKWGSIRSLMEIFPKEFVAFYTGELNLGLTVTYADCNPYVGDILTFEEGYAEWAYEGEGLESYSIEIEENYSGDAIVTENGLIAMIDIYGYNHRNAIFCDSINDGRSNPVTVADGQLVFVVPEGVVVGYKPGDSKIDANKYRMANINHFNSCNSHGVKDGKLIGFHENYTKVLNYGKVVNTPDGKVVNIASIFTVNTAMVFIK